jgi:uncharacterized protein (DUF885 family)
MMLNSALHRRHLLTLAAGAGVSAACAPLAPLVSATSTPPASAANFDAWSEGFAADWMRQSAERVTFSQYFSGAEQAAFERQLTPQTEERRQRQHQLARQGLAQLQAYAGVALTATQREGADTMRWNLQRIVAAEPFVDHSFVFNQWGGPHISLVNFMSESHPMRSAEDASAFVERLRQVPARMDQAIARARRAAGKGLLPPRFILERARTQVEDFLKPAAADNLFVGAFTRRSARISSLPEADRARLTAEVNSLVATDVLPAWQRVLALMNELHPRTTADAGLWRLPDGAAAYAQALANNTTTDMSAEEIHALGLREVARIEAEMDRVLKTLGRSEGTVQARMDALRLSLQPPAEPDPRPALIARFGDHVRDAQRRSQALFNLQPKAPVEVQRVPALTEKTAAAHYTTPAPDGSRPGVFWAPLPGPIFNIPGMRSLAVHEAVPGHHFQLALQQEQQDLPRWRQRRVFSGGSANAEGWALYAERLAIDNGWYADDPASLLGALDGQLFRARRLVVDTGLHAKRWTREQAIAYGINAQEVERYVSNPGQACAYMIGMLRILSLRDEAQRTMGTRFTLKDYHDVVLKTGSVPLDVLAQVVQRWAADGPDTPMRKPAVPAPNKSL